MNKVLFTLPWGAEWAYDMCAVPRLGEHVDIADKTYLVTAICYYPVMNRVRINLEHAG